uniref:actin filament-associated protein 1-like n=1 Tax=Myxine glutinosa TaxID=7769 RepID=UPI00358DEACF
MSKSTGNKLTQIIGRQKRKKKPEISPPCPHNRHFCHRNSQDPGNAGQLNVLTDSGWRECWCQVSRESLQLFVDKEAARTPLANVPLRGCSLAAGLAPKHPLAFKLVREGRDIITLETTFA